MTWMILGIIGGLLLLFAIWAISQYNRFVPQRNQAEEAFSTMDIYLKKRWDMIPNLVEIVKSYAAHERGTFEAVARARSIAMNANNLRERNQSENFLTDTLRQLLAVSENYPQLKADQGFHQLQQQLIMLENDIAQSRKYYNGVAKMFNNNVEKFPTNLIAGMLGFKSYPFFTIDNIERHNVQIRF